MAQVVGVINTSHVWIRRPPRSEWNEIRASRDFLPGVPEDDEDAQIEKEKRIDCAVAELRGRLDRMRPDALVIFGDDQTENFYPDYRLMPSLTIFAGGEFSGRRYDAAREDPHQSVRGHPQLAQTILYSLLNNGFDPAYALGLPRPESGIGHAVMNPLGYYTDYTVRTVPILLNALFAPQMRATRAYQVGLAVRRAIEADATSERVAIIGSGGLWHTGNSAPRTYLDKDFDHVGLDYLTKGDFGGWARFFDGYSPDPGDKSQDVSAPGRVSTGLPPMPGPQYGTRESLNWIAAGAVVDGSPFEIIDYVPLYCSPIGCAFAVCEHVVQ